ncbi:MAG TPA: EAL domain-containing protein, partial [Woeseiaceae bacterium]
TLTECQLPAAYLTLEITESAVMRDAANARSTMKRLRELGIRLAIDDFGTGHSSLAQLKSLPVDELKIDKSFVLGLPRSEDDSVIVKSTIELAHNMGLSVTAEGVETPACRDLLQQFGCDVIQGYLVSRPLGVADFTIWIRARLDERDTCMVRPELPATGPKGIIEDEFSVSTA